MWGLALFGAVGLAAALTRPNATATNVLPTVAGVAAGAFALSRLVRAAYLALPPPAPERIVFGSGPPSPSASPTPASPASSDGRDAAGGGSDADRRDAAEGGSDADRRDGAGGGNDADRRDGAGELRAPGLLGIGVPGGTGPPPAARPGAPSPGRRKFLTSASFAVVAAAVSEVGGRELSTRKNVSAARSALRLPAPSVRAPAMPAGTDLRIPGLSSFITPNGEFYRVDTDLFLPQVDPGNWQLRIHGMVAREVVVSFGTLLRQPLIEDYVTLTCVSNPVSGPYVGNAKWLGARLADLIRSARPLAGADQLLCTSADGFTSGTPLAVVLDGRDALLAVAMNGEALPIEHGFPARLVVPGLYGYVSACKWVADIEVTTFSSAYSYWAQRGWSQQAPIKTESRIDVPAGGTVAPGRVPVAGVAWAQHKGIAAVEVRVDHGPWHEATLAAVPGIDSWRQWVWHWDATPGSHLIEARATDAGGYTQTSAEAPPEPNGATGYPSVNVTVRRS
ncbi:MAG: molybdopterin-dependent oxidoreductase [Streptosporangiaceae bacterium]|nr:molybdopterin-dependent oxidoreductase [Streptosporangiaceae bacterium]MBV9857546.1 molybdopterin-dependent oxidoreductase [Streptosporangiaceae bacterium]